MAGLMEAQLVNPVCVLGGGSVVVVVMQRMRGRGLGRVRELYEREGGGVGGVGLVGL